jgi:hypothetical protein
MEKMLYLKLMQFLERWKKLSSDLRNGRNDVVSGFNGENCEYCKCYRSHNRPTDLILDFKDYGIVLLKKLNQEAIFIVASKIFCNH